MAPDLVEELKKLGLSTYEARVYVTLIQRGESTAGDLSSAADVPRPRIYDILEKLEKRGFVVSTVGRPTRFKAVPPSRALQSLIEEKKKELEEMKARISEVAAKLERLGREEETEGGVWVLRNPSLSRSKLFEVISSATREVVVSLHNHLLSSYGDIIQRAIEDAVTRGVDVKVLLPKNLNLSFEGATVIKREFAPPLILADDKILVPLDDESKILLMENENIAKSFRKTLNL